MRTGLVLAMLLTIVFVAAVLTRGRTPIPGVLRQKPGESEAEARLILLGTYRFYSWLVPVVVVGALIVLPIRGQAGIWLTRADGALAIVVMILAHALYWRLGYGGRRWLFALAHLSGLFALLECYGPLGREVTSHAGE